MAAVEAPPSYDSLFPAGQGVADYGAFGSSETVKSELSIFDGPSYQMTQIKSQLIEIAPYNQYQGTSKCDIKFKLVGAPGWYMDWSDSYISLQLQIMDDKGKEVDEQKVAFENFPLVTLFKDVSCLTENQTKIEGENQNYAYRGYLYTLLNAAYSSKSFQLQSGGWISDDYNELDTTWEAETIDATTKVVTKAAKGNKAFGDRMEWTKKGGILEVTGADFLRHLAPTTIHARWAEFLFEIHTQ